MTPDPFFTSTTSLTIAGLAGSLRHDSFNRSLLMAAKQLAAPQLDIQVLDISEVPAYNQDLESIGVPDAVRRLRYEVKAADALLIATPEYNHSVPGVLKNVMDWLSRPPRASALEGKPTALMGASTGMMGTARAQDQLRQALVFTNSPTLLQPEVLLSYADRKFDSNGRLTDEDTRRVLVSFLQAFASWITRFAPPGREHSTTAVAGAAK